MSKLYFETAYNTELTLESDNMHLLLAEATSLNRLLNRDSYIGLNNYLNSGIDECVGSIRHSENTLIYIMVEDEVRYFFLASEHKEGVTMAIYGADQPFMYNRIIVKHGLDMEVA